MRDIPLNGFGPDDPVTPGFFTRGSGYEFTRRGLRIQRALSTYASGGASIRNGLRTILPSGTAVIHLAAATNLYRVSGATITNANRAAAYNGNADQWSFASWGNIVFATNGLDTIQYRDATTANAFADLAATGAPTNAKILVRWGPPAAPLLMALAYTTGGTYYPSAFWNSHIGGPLATWTPDVATSAYNQNLLTHEFTAGLSFKDDVLMFNERETYLGRFQGSTAANPIAVPVTRIADDIGCVGMYACCTVNGVAYWVGKSGIFFFDGSYPRKLNVPIQDWLIRKLADGTVASQYTQLQADAANQRLILVLRNSNFAAVEDSTNSAIESICLQNMRVGQLYPISRTGALGNGYWYGAAAVYLEALTPAQSELSTGAQWTMNAIGDYEQDTVIGRVQVRPVDHATNRPSALLITQRIGTDPGTGGTSNTGTTATDSPWRVDLLGGVASGKWHSFSFQVHGIGASNRDPEIVGIAHNMPKGSGRT